MRQDNFTRQNGKCNRLKITNEKADKSGAAYTVIIAEDEVNANQITIKTMATGEQRRAPIDYQFIR